MIAFTVYGNPVAQGRPRATKLPTGKILVYDPKNAKEWKQLVKLQAIDRKPFALYQGPIVVELSFQLLRPKSLPKKVTEHIKRPDLENLSKAVLDALKGVVYRDDSQIIELRLRKFYAYEGETAQVHITVREEGHESTL